MTKCCEKKWGTPPPTCLIILIIVIMNYNNFTYESCFHSWLIIRINITIKIYDKSYILSSSIFLFFYLSYSYYIHLTYFFSNPIFICVTNELQSKHPTSSVFTVVLFRNFHFAWLLFHLFHWYFTIKTY